MARICPTCGEKNPDRFRLCGMCGASLDPATGRPVASPDGPSVATSSGSALASPTGTRHERKTITALFCDLVGSTELAERLDPEDVDAILRAYHAMARRHIEANGGVVEKFIGDAIVGVFGVPASHEDDSERAISAAFRIVRDLRDGASGSAGAGDGSANSGLSVRIGIQAGEALVRLDRGTTTEEGFATGECLNVAARLQALAPDDGIVVGGLAHDLAGAAFAWEDLGPVALKGKAEPVRAWRPIGVASRPMSTSTERSPDPAATTPEATPFLGRESELETLVSVVERSRETRSVEIVTILAGAGFGKSRLVRELGRRVRAVAPRTTWLTGRCLPYGDGVSFWALGEIVKGLAGILETDELATIADKVDRALSRSVAATDASDRAWLHDRVGPLVGLPTAGPAPQREESFTAWRRLLEGIARVQPAVVVVEDLHWADEAFVAFLEHLVDRSVGVPLTVLVSARLEVSERHPSWLGRRARPSDPGTSVASTTVLRLEALGTDHVRTLVESTLAEAPAELLATILDRAGGSPLFAEQLAHMIRERGLTAADGTLVASLIPPTIQALIAARIDHLPGDLKAPLLDASVVGRTFWSGAVAGLADRDREAVDDALDDLARREFTRTRVPSSMAGDDEWAFWHALMRDVAYAELPRRVRLAKHRAAAEWIERQVGERLPDVAQIVAYHYTTALELARIVGDADTAAAIVDPALRVLMLAGERALLFDAATAVTLLERADDLAPSDHPERPAIQVLLGRATRSTGAMTRTVALYEEALAAFEEAGDRRRTAETSRLLGDALGNMGQTDRPRELYRAALAYFEAEEPGPSLVAVLVKLAEQLGSEDPECQRLEDRALDIVREHDLADELPAVVGSRALRLVNLGDVAGIAELRRAFALALERNQIARAAMYCDWLVFWLTVAEGPEAALAMAEQGLRLVDGRGFTDWTMAIRADRLAALFRDGAWDTVLRESGEIIAWAETGGHRSTAFDAIMVRAEVLSLRGAIAEGAALVEPYIEAETGPLDPWWHMVGTWLRGLREQGRSAEAESLLERLIADGEAYWASGPPCGPFLRRDFGREAAALGRVDLVRRLAAVPGFTWAVSTRAEDESLEALVAEGEGRLLDATAAYRAAIDEADSPFDRAWAELGAGRCLAAAGEPDGARPRLRTARDGFAALGAAPWIAETDEILGRVGGGD